jgi:hypothetical protein
MAPEISPPGRFAHKNNRPPAVPIASVSTAISAFFRLGSATATDETKDATRDETICLTPPYGKSGNSEQLR